MIPSLSMLEDPTPAQKCFRNGDGVVVILKGRMKHGVFNAGDNFQPVMTSSNPIMDKVVSYRSSRDMAVSKRKLGPVSPK